jgi:hypothetical protein
MSTYGNNLRLEEIGSGERSGTWGTATNLNLKLIGEALGYGTEAITTNADTHTTSIADGAVDSGRAMYLKYTGTLDSQCTITIGPNNIKRVHIIENATSGSQSIVISQGSGSNVTIPNGSVKVVYLDGGDSAANVVDAFTDLDVAGTFAVAGNTTVGGTLTSTGAVTANAGVVVDNITIDGTEIDLSSGDLTLDVAGDIVLNSDDGIIFLKDDTATFGSLNNSSGNLIIKSGTTTAATFSGANVTLAGTVVTGGLTTLGGNLVIPNDGNIGSVGDTDAIAIASNGIVTFSQNITGTLGTAAQTNITSVGTLDAGAISSNFGAINNGGSGITTTGTVTGGTITTSGTVNFGSLHDGAITVTAFVDEDNMNSNSDTLIPTQQSVKAYVDNSTATTATGIVGSGVGNTAIGTNALDSIPSSGANFNTALGFDVLTAHAAQGSGNTAVGYEAMEYFNHTSGDNVAIGYRALKGQTTDFDGSSVTHRPDNMVAIGPSAAYNALSSSAGVAIGKEAFYYSRGDYSIAIGWQSQYGSVGTSQASNGDNNISLGQKSLHLITTGDDNIAIGRNASYSNTTAAINIAIGLNALHDNTGSGRNIAIGEEACFNTVSSNSIGIGYYSLRGSSSTTTDASYNVAIGSSSLTAITTGDSNTAVGSSAGIKVTTGHNNVLVGMECHGPTTGDGNVAVGKGALSSDLTGGDYNVAMGFEAMRYASGEYNVGIGQSALKGDFSTAMSGSDNVCIGRSAGASITSASDSVFIGGIAGYQITTGEYNVAVGYQALSGSTGTKQRCTALGYGAGDSITSGDNLTCLGHNADASSATATNEITLGDANVATLRCNDQSIGSLSDGRDKTDIVNSKFGLDFINSIRPVQFKWERRNLVEGDLTASKNGKTRLGFIAQEFQEAMPNNENDILDLVYESNPERLEAKYGNLIPILTKAIQELSRQNKELENRIIELENG